MSKQPSEQNRSQPRQFSLKPTYKQDNPNPHAHARGYGRNYFPTPATVVGRFWHRLGVESHVALTLAVLPLVAFGAYALTIGVSPFVVSGYALTVIAAYAIYYSWKPREAKHVIVCMNNLYNAQRFAVLSSGIFFASVLAVILVVIGLFIEAVLPIGIANVSVTIGFFGIVFSLLCSYLLIRVLVARALPVQSNPPLLDRIVGLGIVVEVLFILGTILTPAFLFAAQFLWNRPQLFTIDFALSHNAVGTLLTGFVILYISLITRM